METNYERVTDVETNEVRYYSAETRPIVETQLFQLNEEEALNNV